jgi:hypothetical protein
MRRTPVRACGFLRTEISWKDDGAVGGSAGLPPTRPRFLAGETMPTPDHPSADIQRPRLNVVIAKVVDEGRELATREGVGPAVSYMTERGVPSTIAYRVLGSPYYCRKTQAP